MRRIILGLFVIMGLAAAVHAQDDKTVEAPVFKPGDSWTYQRISKYDRNRTGKFTITITSITETGYETSRTVLAGDIKESKAKYTKEMNATYENGHNNEPFVPYFSFPLTPGKQWQGSWKYMKIKTKKMNKYYNATMKSRVQGWETVKTPAGEFRALKISFQAQHIDNRGRGKNTEGIRWYCPEVRQVVRTELKDKGGASREEVKELIAFKPAP